MSELTWCRSYPTVRGQDLRNPIPAGFHTATSPRRVIQLPIPIKCMPSAYLLC